MPEACVARMERSAIRVCRASNGPDPNFASLHPGHLLSDQGEADADILLSRSRDAVDRAGVFRDGSDSRQGTRPDRYSRAVNDGRSDSGANLPGARQHS